MRNNFNYAGSGITEARRLCGIWGMALVTSALCARGNGRGREGDGVTGSPWSEAMSALVTARKIPVQVILGIPLLDSGAGGEIADSVSRLVLATKSHVSTEVNAAVLIDVDLSILGQSEARFKEYERQIREEYSWVPETIFAAKRAEILEGFLTRE